MNKVFLTFHMTLWIKKITIEVRDSGVVRDSAGHFANLSLESVPLDYDNLLSVS